MKYRIAIGTNDKIHVTDHFGGCRQFTVVEIDQEKDEINYIEERPCAYNTECGEHRDEVLRDKIKQLSDCQMVLVVKIGGQSEKFLNHNNMIALQYQGTIESALMKIIKFYKKHIFIRKEIDYDRDNCQQEKSETEV